MKINITIPEFSVFEKALMAIASFFAFVGTYFFKLGADNFEQFMAVIVVVIVDGALGIWAGSKKEGFQTKKALNILLVMSIWIVLLGCILSIEKGFQGTSWLSEVIIPPFMVFQLVSALKNAHRLGFVKNELLNTILEKIDKHKS